MKKGTGFILSLAVVLLMGCGSSNYKYEDLATTTEAAMAVDGNYFRDEVSARPEMAVEEESSSYVQNSDRKLIKTVHMSVETESFDEFISNVSRSIEELGGYAEEFGKNGYSSYRYANITARIPKKNYDTFMESVEGKANVISKNETVEDVTLQYVDIKSHKEALQTEEERLLELMKKAESIDDIIALEDKLADTRYRLDSMESQLRTYDNKIDFVTIYLNIEEVVRYTPPKKLTTGERIATGFKENLYDLGQTITDMFVWFIVYIPNIIITVVVVVIIIIVAKRIYKKRKKDK